MSKALARARRGLMAALVAGALSAVPVSTALACSCMQATIPQSMEFADIAFIGTTKAVEAPPPGDVVNTADPIHYAFAVDRIYKGDVIDAEIVASSAMDGASCGTSFGIDERWLVFANVTDGEIWTGLCSGNVLLADEETETATVAELGEPVAEPEPAAAEAEAEGFEVPLALVVAIAAGVVVLGVSAWAFVIEPRRRVS
jgi:hypothetical protein